MRRSTWLYLVPLILLASGAQAAAVSPPGVNLRWDACYGDGGVWNKTFACDTNGGTERLVGSFELAQPFNQVSGLEIYVDLSAQGATLPPWWTYKNAGTCRPTSLNSNPTVPPASVICVDWSQGFASGGLAAYSMGNHGPQTARIIAGFAVPASDLADLNAGQEYYAFTMTINHAKTVGTGACAGCDVPVCIFLSRILLVTPPVVGQPSRDFQLDRGANYLGSQYVTWQNGYPINVQQQCDVPSFLCNRHYTSFGCVLATPTSSHGSTWGQLKSSYR